MLGSSERPIHPNKPVVKNRDSKLVVHPSLVELVGIKLRVF